MAKLTTRVGIPAQSPENLIILAKNIITHHQTLGASSPLHQLDIATFISQAEEAEQTRRKSQAARAEAEALMQHSRAMLGIDKGQNSHTKGTVYHLLLQIRDLLLLIHDGVEEELSVYGFNVVTSQSKVGRKKKIAQ